MARLKDTTVDNLTVLDKLIIDGVELGSRVTIETSGAVSQTIVPNVYYEFTSAALTSLTITLLGELPGKVNEFMFEFKSPATPATLTAISGVTWVGDVPVIEASLTYQVSILNGIGIIVGV